jgi:hypothetical protein
MDDLDHRVRRADGAEGVNRRTVYASNEALCYPAPVADLGGGIVRWPRVTDCDQMTRCRRGDRMRRRKLVLGMTVTMAVGMCPPSQAQQGTNRITGNYGDRNYGDSALNSDFVPPVKHATDQLSALSP